MAEPRALRTQDDIPRLIDVITDLTPIQKATLKERYRFMMREYRRRIVLYTFLFYTLKMTMTVGSLAVPALLSLKTTPEGAEILYWFTWGMSLAVTTANGLSTLFKVDKRFFMIRTVAEQIRTEMWQFLALSGYYSGHFGGEQPTHANQYVYFTTRLEKIRMRHIEDEFVRGAELGNEQKPGTDTTKQQGGPPPSQGPPPTPANPASLRGRRDSTSTVGSNETEHTQKEGGTVSVSVGADAAMSSTSPQRVTVLSPTSELRSESAIGVGTGLQPAGLQLRSPGAGNA
jgi:hypothetical protein